MLATSVLSVLFVWLCYSIDLSQAWQVRLRGRASPRTYPRYTSLQTVPMASFLQRGGPWSLRDTGISTSSLQVVPLTYDDDDQDSTMLAASDRSGSSTVTTTSSSLTAKEEQPVSNTIVSSTPKDPPSLNEQVYEGFEEAVMEAAMRMELLQSQAGMEEEQKDDKEETNAVKAAVPPAILLQEIDEEEDSITIAARDTEAVPAAPTILQSRVDTTALLQDAHDVVLSGHGSEEDSMEVDETLLDKPAVALEATQTETTAVTSSEEKVELKTILKGNSTSFQGFAVGETEPQGENVLYPAAFVQPPRRESDTLTDSIRQHIQKQAKDMTLARMLQRKPRVPVLERRESKDEPTTQTTTRPRLRLIKTNRRRPSDDEEEIQDSQILSSSDSPPEYDETEMDGPKRPRQMLVKTTPPPPRSDLATTHQEEFDSNMFPDENEMQATLTLEEGFADDDDEESVVHLEEEEEEPVVVRRERRTWSVPVAMKRQDTVQHKFHKAVAALRKQKSILLAAAAIVMAKRVVALLLASRGMRFT